MNLVTNVGKTLAYAGTKAVKFVAKHPKTTLMAIGAYEVAHIATKAKKEVKEQKSTLSLLAKIGAAVVAAIILKKAGTKIMQNPEVKEAASKLAEKSKVLKENLKELFNNASKVAKKETEKIVKGTTAKTVKIQYQPKGIVKNKLDKIIANYKNNISVLSAEKFHIKGSNEEFSKKIQSMYKEFVAKYPEYSDYINRRIGKLASNF